MCHHGDERDLADVGRFARHVRAGEDLQARAFRVELGVVWHKLRVGEGLFEHRVAAIGDRERIGSIKLRAAVTVDLCDFGQRAEHIDFRDCGGGFLNAREMRHHLRAQLREELGFELFGSFFGAEHFVFHLLERGGDVALGIRHRLLARVIIRHLGEVAGGDFDEVAKDIVELDLERIDAGAFAFVFLQACDPVLAAARGVAEFVEFRRPAVADDAAIAQIGRWLIGERGCEQRGEIGKIVELRGECEIGSAKRNEIFFQRWDMRERDAE